MGSQRDEAGRSKVGKIKSSWETLIKQRERQRLKKQQKHKRRIVSDDEENGKQIYKRVTGHEEIQANSR